MNNVSDRRPSSMRKEIVCFECMNDNHLDCNGSFERCDCWECLEQEIHGDYLVGDPDHDDESEDD
jgi:hypothetical protein